MSNKLNGTAVICFKHAEDIANYIGENPKEINNLVQYEDLPAWKRCGRGAWRALNIDLDRWMIDQRTKYIKNRKIDAQKNGVNS